MTKGKRYEKQTFHVGHIPTRDLRPILQKPVHPFFEARKTVYDGRFERKSRVQRNEPNEAADRQLHTVVAPLNRIVVHSILVVPEADVIVTTVIRHSIRDEDEVLW